MTAKLFQRPTDEASVSDVRQPRPKRSNKPQPMQIMDIDYNPWQPRKIVRDENLGTLRESILNYGFIGHLEVRKDPDRSDGRFQLVYGHRRLEAARLAGLTKIPVEIVNYTDQQMMELALLENIAREDLTPWEEAQQMEQIKTQTGLSLRSLAEFLGVHKSYVENRLALLKLPEQLRERAQNGELDVTTALAINRFRRKSGVTEQDVNDLIVAYDQNNLTGEQFIELQKAAVDYKQRTTDDDGHEIRTIPLQALVERVLLDHAGDRQGHEPMGPDPMAVAKTIKPVITEVDNEPQVDEEAVRESYIRVDRTEWTNSGERYAAVLMDQLRGVVQHIIKNVERADLQTLTPEQREELYGLRDHIIKALNKI